MPNQTDPAPRPQGIDAAARRPWRGVAVPVLGIVLAAAIGAAAFAITGHREDVPTADEALIEVKTLNASVFAETTGPYSRFGWSHPGPIMFYALAPTYVLGHHEPRGLYVGAVLLNLLFAGLALRAAYSMGPASLAACAIALAVMAWRAQPILASPWNPHLLVFPWFALLVCGGAWIHGAGPAQLAAVGLCATWLVQTHVGAAPSVLALLATIVALKPRRLLTRPAAVAGLFTLLLWLPVVADVVRQGSQSNLAAIAEWMIHGTSDRPGMRGALTAAVESLTAFLRPQPLVTPLGWAWKASGVRTLAWAALPVIALAALIRARRAALAGAIAGVVCAAAAYTCWSVRGEMVDHLVFWLGGGLPAVAVIACYAPRHDTARARRLAAMVGITAFGVLAGLALHALSAMPLRVNPDVAEATRVLVARVGVRLNGAVVELDDGSWGEAAGIVARLRSSGYRIRVPAEFDYMFGRRVTAGLAPAHLRILVRRDGTGGELDVRAARGEPDFAAGGLHVWFAAPARGPARP